MTHVDHLNRERAMMWDSRPLPTTLDWSAVKAKQTCSNCGRQARHGWPGFTKHMARYWFCTQDCMTAFGRR